MPSEKPLAIDSAGIGAMFTARKKQLTRCFYPSLKCEESAIRAHSVQNSKVLDLLVDNGHVYSMGLKLDVAKGPQISLKAEGRHKATTFTGLCAKHDKELFTAIEDSPLDVQADQHRFLLAYRAAFWELHAAGSVGMQMQNYYEERVRLGLDKRNSGSAAARFAVERLFVAWQVWLWKSELDVALLEEKWDVLAHKVLVFPVTQPTVAASALFSIGTHANGKDLRCVALSVLPLSLTSTCAILSYKPKDKKAVKKKLASLLNGSGVQLKKELSRRLLKSCQNFVLAPQYVETWSTAKRKAVVDYFTKTIFTKGTPADDDELQLFA